MSGDKIKRGLLDAIAFAKGDKSKGKMTQHHVTRPAEGESPAAGLKAEKCTFLYFDLPTVTTQRDRLRAALQRLVDAKNEKDANGDTPRYRELKSGAWEEAREVLGKLARSQ